MRSQLSILIGIMFALAGCNANISAEIFLADINELYEGEDLTAKVMIGLPIPSEDDCADEEQRYTKVFRKSSGFKDMEFVRCYQDGYDNFMEYELAVPMRMVNPRTTSMVEPFEIVRHDSPYTDAIALYFRHKPSALCNLDELINDEFGQSLDLSDASPNILITNDMREAQTLILYHVFVYGRPATESPTFKLDRHDSLRIPLSNVTSAWVFSKSCSLQKRTALVGVVVPDQSECQRHKSPVICE